MPVVLAHIRRYLHDFAWKPLFIEVLHWSQPTERPFSLLMERERFTLTPVAQMGGMYVYVCRAASGEMPTSAIRARIENQVKERQYEHIILFEDGARQQVLLQWMKRGQGVARSREYAYKRGQKGDAFIQRLSGIAFDLADLDAEGQIDIAKVVERATQSLDIEHVTKKFYTEFTQLRERFQTFLRGVAAPTEDDARWYVSVMLNRLMFIYFVQSKGFLAGDPQYLQHKLAWSKAHLGTDRYYRAFLRVLFFEGFAKEAVERSPEVQLLLGAIPYLNGGLFIPHALEEKYGDTLDVPDAAFDTLFAFFGKWRWHLSERPGEHQNEIDPDVLGYIFEKYINQKQMGAYYTKEDITGYICRNTIIPRLFDKANLSLDLLKLPQTIRAYLYPSVTQRDYLPTENACEYQARQQRVARVIAEAEGGAIATINDAITANLNLEGMIFDLIPMLDAHALQRLYDALTTLSVLDPTCGSGAFLFAAIKILKPIYAQVLERMAILVEREETHGSPFQGILATEQAHANRDYFITKSIVVRNLYGVDIMEEATEICKLRLFLRLMADLEDAEHIEPLPDVDFNIRAGNALVGYATLEDVGGSYRGGVTALPPRVQRLVADVQDVQRKLRAYRDTQLQFSHSSAAFREHRQHIREQIATLNAAFDSDMLKMGQIQVGRSHGYTTQPFHWFTAFYEILGQGGFDVIVGNPPYIGYHKVKREYEVFGYQTQDSGNLYAFLIERALTLLLRSGRFGVIVPIASISTDGMKSLQALYGRYTQWHSNYAVRPGKLFVGVDMNLTITLLHRAATPPRVYCTSYYRWFSGEESDRAFLFEKLAYCCWHQIAHHANPFPKISHPIEVDILTKMHRHGMKVKDFVTSQGASIYYHSGGRYWRKALREKLSSHYKPLVVPERIRPVVLTLLNSQLFYWYWIANSNCMDVVAREVVELPVFDLRRIDVEPFMELEEELLAAYMSHQTTRARRGETISTDEINVDVRKAKPILDGIDAALAECYDFTPAERDFIINYDIKYRMGRDVGDA